MPEIMYIIETVECYIHVFRKEIEHLIRWTYLGLRNIEALKRRKEFMFSDLMAFKCSFFIFIIAYFSQETN